MCTKNQEKKFNRLIMQIELFVNHHCHESKHIESIFSLQPLAGKVMFNVFCDLYGVVMIDFFCKGVPQLLAHTI